MENLASGYVVFSMMYKARCLAQWGVQPILGTGHTPEDFSWIHVKEGEKRRIFQRQHCICGAL